MSKEVTLRQCDSCERKFDEDSFIIDDWGDCPWCKVRSMDTCNEKTEFVLIEKPRDWALGETIMKAYRKLWEKIICHSDGKICNDIYHISSCKVVGKEHWNIWEQDTPDIQEKINAINK